MNSLSTSHQSHITLYTRTWIGVLGLVISVKLLGATQDQMGYLNMAVLALTGILLMGLNYYEGHRLMAYLKRNHPQMWQHITYVPGFGSGGTNGFRALQFLKSGDDLGDPNVQWLKDNYRRFLRLMWIMFITYPILFIMTVFF